MQPHWSKRAVRNRTNLRLTGHRQAGYTCDCPDRKSSLLSMADLRSEIHRAGIYHRTWIAERYDCEDFARDAVGAIVHHCAGRTDMLYAPAICQVWGTIDNVRHAIGGALLDDGEFYLWEPQADGKIWKPRRWLDRMIWRVRY